MIVRVDYYTAFAEGPHKGASSAVAFWEEWAPDFLLKAIAAKVQGSITTFMMQIGNGSYHIRWFQGEDELDFCGQGSLAGTKAYFDHYRDRKEVVLYAQMAGEYFAYTKYQDAGALIELELPITPLQKLNDVPELLRKGLSVQPRNYHKNAEAYYAVYDSEDEVRNLKPDLKLLSPLGQLGEKDPRKLVLTSPGKDFDIVSRSFHLDEGMEEEVSVSVHRGLVPHWAKELGRKELRAFQASEGGAVLHCRLHKRLAYIGGQTERGQSQDIEITRPQES